MSDIGEIKAGVVVQRRVSAWTVAWLIFTLGLFAVAAVCGGGEVAGGGFVVYKVRVKVKGTDRVLVARLMWKLKIGGEVQIWYRNENSKKCTINTDIKLPIERKKKVKDGVAVFGTVERVGFGGLMPVNSRHKIRVRIPDIENNLICLVDMDSTLKVGDKVRVVYNPKKPKWCEIVES